MSGKSETTTDGVRAVELFYRDIRRTSDNEPVFLYTQMRLNGPEMGVLEPADYRAVSELSDQCSELFALGMHQLLQAMNKFQERDIMFKWASLYMPVRFLKRDDAAEKLNGLCGRYKIKPEMLCFEVSASALEETDGAAADNMDKLRRKGYHFMLDDFGTTSSPMLKLADFSFDYAVLSPEIAASVCRNDRAESCVRSVVSFVKELGAECIAAETTGKDQTERLFDCECAYYMGELAGTYHAERYMRRKGD